MYNTIKRTCKFIDLIFEDINFTSLLDICLTACIVTHSHFITRTESENNQLRSKDSNFPEKNCFGSFLFVFVFILST